MEASVRLFASTRRLDRRLPLSIKTTFQHRRRLALSIPNLTFPSASLAASRSSDALPLLLSLTLSRMFSSPPPSSSHFNRFDPSAVDANQEQYLPRNWPVVGDAGGSLGLLGDEGADLTVVLLGWLGAEKRHLKRYAELYTTRGVRAVEFVVPVSDFLGLDLGRRVESRIMALAEELIEWLSETEKDGKERGLLFHTFSNTGWLAYGAILDNFQQRGDSMKRIKGCVIDSGGDPEINPQVWAAGFAAALLKKRSSSAVSSANAVGGNPSACKEDFLGMQDDKTSLIETLLLSVLEKFFSHLLKLPDVNRTKEISVTSRDEISRKRFCLESHIISVSRTDNLKMNVPLLVEKGSLAVGCLALIDYFASEMRYTEFNVLNELWYRRLSKVISILFSNQPPCPQLYLYSTADKVIPARSIEYFMEEQKKSGRQVWTHNFSSSPHVDHFRSFPHVYCQKLYQFLDFFVLKVCQT